MAALTNSGEALLIDWLLRKDAVATPIRPPAIYISLHTADPGETGSFANEVSGSGYTRAQVLFASSAGTGETQNSNLVTFPTSTGSWGTITHFGLCDALTGGTMLMFGIAGVSTVVGSGFSYTVAAGALTLRFD